MPYRDIAILKEFKYRENWVEIIFNWAEWKDRIEWIFKINFETIQLFKVITIDSCEWNMWDSIFFEIENSELIEQLKRKIDCDFYDKSRHFRLYFYDDCIDVIAYNINLTKIE